MSNILLVIAITIFVIYFFGFVFTILTIFLERKYKKQIKCQIMLLIFIVK